MSSLSPFSGVDTADGRRRYFLDACFLCKKPIASNCDIFMYRGDAPFCSEDCRQEQIDMDEALQLEQMISRLTVPLIRSSSSPSSVKRKPSLVFSSKARLEAGTAAVAG